MVKITFTPAAVDLMAEILEQFIDNYGEAATSADYDGDKASFKIWSEKVLGAKTILAQVKSAVKP